MSESVDCSSSISSISLLEYKTETRLVLKAFLHRTLDITPSERPGRVGGAYKEYNIFRFKPQPKPKDELDSKREDAPSGEEKKTGFKELLKQLPIRNTSRRQSKDPKATPDRDSRPKLFYIRDQLEDDVLSPSSTSDDSDNDRKLQRRKSQKKLRKRISKFFKLNKSEKEPNINPPGSNPLQPNKPFTDKGGEPSDAMMSPSHSPAFYNEVAEKLEKIAKRSTSVKKVPRVSPPSTKEVCNKEEVVRQLVQVLSLEGDTINAKIQANPFLRTSLDRLSYASYTRLVDAFSCSQMHEAPPLQPAASPTLRRIAITMEVSRRIVTATGTHRMQGYAECYMETFTPWVKSHGGWEKLMDVEEFD